MHASIGDRIIVQTETLGKTPRQGTVEEVLAGYDAEHYRVRWDDGHESLLFPGPDTRVLKPAESTSGTVIPEQRQAPRPSAPTPDDPVRRIMGAPLITVDAHDSLRNAARTMAYADVGALVVLSDEVTPLGIVCERDIVRALASEGDPDEVWAADAIGADTVWADPSDSIADVARLMRDSGARHVPVHVQDAVVGMVSMRDVLDVMGRR
ncbi:CBS domain-containing protein [Thermasporomyces composti]|jgi:CBS domain-containing protein|uniref:CBS domain protein n=1 Tax=Thermasporomyces composti TaxID=696763 RepID=A0A3D9V6E1_THECX|nr:CBS domain-containing protein [Thermasporomyces composti]REF35750.1 CBS domain protein [Thermasporomyces composti]